MSGLQWFALTDWGRRYLAALSEWELGLRKERPKGEDFRPRVPTSKGTTAPPDAAGPKR